MTPDLPTGSASANAVSESAGAPASTTSSRARPVFLSLCVVHALLMGLCAYRMPLFGDEAFYAWEAGALALGYSDLPPLTAWAIALGSSLLPAEIGVRLVFLMSGLAVPWLALRMGIEAHGREAGWWAGILVFGVPLAWVVPVLALPDALLLVLTATGLLLMMRALREGRWSALPTGLVIAAGFLTHYRFALTAMAGLVALLCLRRGRQLLRSTASLRVAALGLCGILPTLIWNLDNGFAAIAFQASDRHPWAFDISGLRQILEQLVVIGPLLAPLALASGLNHLSSSDDYPDGVRFIALAGALLVLGYLVLGFFADAERTRFHWMLPGWLALLVVLARWLGQRPVSGIWILVPGLLMGLCAALLLLRISLPAAWPEWPWYPDNFRGWREISDAVSRHHRAGEIVVADNFMLGAQLAHGMDGRIEVLSEAHPLNSKHGREAQLEIWRHPARIQEAIQAEQPVLLVVEETSLEIDQRASHYRALCARHGGFDLLERVTVDGLRKRFTVLRSSGQHGSQPVCEWPAQVYAQAQWRRDGLEIDGWVESPTDSAKLMLGTSSGQNWPLQRIHDGDSGSEVRKRFMLRIEPAPARGGALWILDDSGAVVARVIELSEPIGH